MGPLYGLWSAMTHPLPEERLGAAEALAAATIGPAWAAHADGLLGRLAPGSLADLVVLSGDPTRSPADKLQALPIATVMVAGEWVSGSLSG